LRSRGRPRALPGAGGAGDRGLRPGARRANARRPSGRGRRRARRLLVLRDEDDRGGRGRGGGGPGRARRARARGSRLRRAGDAGAAHQRQAHRHGRGACARPARAPRRLRRAAPCARRPLSRRARRRAGPAARRRGGFLVARPLPSVRGTIAASGLGWAYLVALAFALALVSVPLVRALARWWGVLDAPAARKVHAVATPLLGGAAVYAAFAATVLFNFTFSLTLKGVALGATIVVGIGVLDDLLDVPARWKLAVQVVAVAVAMGYGGVLDTIPTA